VAEKLVQQVRLRQPKMGTRKLYFLLKPQFLQAGLKLGRDGLFDALRRARMLVHPKRCYRKTTNSKHWMHKHPNLVKAQAKPRTCQKFCVRGQNS